MFGHLRKSAVALAISVALSGCVTVDEDYMDPASRAIPVVSAEALNASGGIAPLEILGTVEFETSLYPNDPYDREMLMFHHMAQEAKRKYPQADALVITQFGTIWAGSFAKGNVVRRR